MSIVAFTTNAPQRGVAPSRRLASVKRSQVRRLGLAHRLSEEWAPILQRLKASVRTSPDREFMPGVNYLVIPLPMVQGMPRGFVVFICAGHDEATTQSAMALAISEIYDHWSTPERAAASQAASDMAITQACGRELPEA